VQIIRRLREFTKGQSVELESLQPNDLVREAVELVAYEIRRVGAALRLDLADDLPPLVGDRIQLEQLLVNLMMNACQAMEQTPPNSRVLRIRTQAAGESIIVSVKDAGMGVDDGEVHRLFEAFYTTKKEGMGMGLVLCKSIAEAHGIDLSFKKNEDGPGMTFLLTIPRTGAHVS
jgi:C4-dicarboxylate-specific signal transduction histidine kinase